MFASLAETYSTVDADLMYTNGIRVSKPSLMISSFKGEEQKDSIEVDLRFSDIDVKNKLYPTEMNKITSNWNKTHIVLDTNDNGSV